MKLPEEIRDRVVALSVTEESIVEIYSHFPSIKYFVSETKVDWVSVSASQTLSEDFIRGYQDHLDWFYVSRNQQHILSEDFIVEFRNFVDWQEISQFQKLSEEFMRSYYFFLSHITCQYIKNCLKNLLEISRTM
jgi:hypothetical protein